MSASPAKSKKPAVKKPVKPAEHPTYAEMIAVAITTLKERGGSSRQKIKKYIQENYKVGDNLGSQLKLALKRGVAAGKLLQPKGTGASGSFKVAKVEKPKKPAAPKKKAVAKPKKVTAPKKKPAVKKPAAKKPAAKKAKKAVAKKVAKSPKKPAAKKPVKKAAKKPAAKKPAAKKPAKKAAAKKGKK